MRQPLHAHISRAWGSGTSTPSGENEPSAHEEGSVGGDVPGAWPGVPMEELIRRALEEDDAEGGVVERLAERIARGRKTTGRPRALKRHETA